MSLILVDIGNSAIKLSFVPSRIADSVGSSLDATCQMQRINDWSEFDFTKLAKATCIWTVACVNKVGRNELAELLGQAGRKNDKIHSVHHDLVDLKIDVEQPKAVGIDRLIGCFAASQGLAENEAAIVIDAGTAVTIDLVTGSKVFCGGVIYPGVNASCFQLNQQTAALPLLGLFRETKDLGRLAGRSRTAGAREDAFALATQYCNGHYRWHLPSTARWPSSDSIAIQRIVTDSAREQMSNCANGRRD